MASPLNADAFIKALKAEGCTVVEVGDWRTHNRNHKGPWGEVHGVLVHHTVSKGTASTVELCRHGYASLPGPLCHGVIGKDGKVYLVGYGRTNHAGGGDPKVLEAVKAESYGATPPKPTKGNTDGVDGNRHFYGFECENLGDGKDPWPVVQLEAIERASAALCRAHSWSAKSVIGHKEWSDDKSDPRGFTMTSMRDRVSKRLGGKPSTPAPVPPRPPASKPVVSLSRLVAAAKSDPAKAGTPVSYSGVKVVEAALVKEGLLEKRYADGHYGTSTRGAYEAWQKRLGYRGVDADGIPGAKSLSRLAGKYGFIVSV